MLNSLSETWNHIVRYTETFTTEDKAMSEIEWKNVEMNVREIPLVFFSRAKIIRHNRARHWVITSYAGANNRHDVRRLRSDYATEKSVLLERDAIDFDILKRPVTRDHGDIEIVKARSGGS